MNGDSGDGILRRQDQVALDAFIQAEDRTELLAAGPPFFSGREPELGVFRDMLDGLEGGRLANATYLVQGPPGAGKTALMSQCMAEASTRPPTKEGRVWLPVVVPSKPADDPTVLGRLIDLAIAGQIASPAGRERREGLLAEIEAMAGSLGPAEGAAALEAVGSIKETLGALEESESSRHERLLSRMAQRVPGLIGAAAKGRAREVVREILDRGGAIAGLSIGPRRGANRPTLADIARDRSDHWDTYQIVIFIDEGQNIRPAEMGALSDIHEGRSGARLSLCVFGLPGALEALRKTGISRTVAKRSIALGALEDVDCAMAAKRCFARFRVRNSGDWERAVVARSLRWPQHLAGYLVAAMRELKPHWTPDGGCDAAQADLDAALSAGDESRLAYCRQRAESLGAPYYLKWAAQVAAALRTSPKMDISDLERLLIGADGKMAGWDERQAFVAAAVHSGFLAFDLRGRCSTPIPSFSSFLLGEDPDAA